jgi:hypothetical protein
MAPAAVDDDEILKDEKNPPPLDEDDIALLKTYVCSIYFFIFLNNSALNMG